MTTRYVRRGPYHFHPDEVTVRHVQQGLARNKARYGKGYCPCRAVEGDSTIDRANICPCRSHKGDIARTGTCECGIFVSDEFLRKYAELGGVGSGRRPDSC
jgi:ferredoxin-thioredoxin reductase catalytic subunit